MYRPGETLPPFPDPTHGLGAGQKPFPSIAQSLSAISGNAVDHDVVAAARNFRPKPPLDPNGLCGTITCSGGGDNVYHPSGLRNYTLAEKALLQTFPADYVFRGQRGERARQIGNAVPPAFAAALFRSLAGWMAATDAAESAG